MEITLHIDKQSFTKKPESSSVWAENEAGQITKRITDTETTVTPEQLAQLVGVEGHSVCLATMGYSADGKKHRRNANMIQQQVLALDFDNKDDDTGVKTEGLFYQSIEDTLADEFIKAHAVFIYKTFSYTPEWEKFRVVFILDKPLTSPEAVTGAYTYLHERFPNADKKVKDAARLIYGGCLEAIGINYNNTLPTEQLPAVAPAIKKTKTAKAADVTPEAPKATITKGEIPTWLLIKQGRKEEVKERWSIYGEGEKFADELACINHWKSIPLSDLLGIHQNPFCDIFGQDKTPSASIWKPEDTNIWLYAQLNKTTRTGATPNFNIIGIIQKLLSSKGNDFHYGQAIDYLKDTTGVTIEATEELERVRREANHFKLILLSAAFKSEHPEMYQILGKYNYAVTISAMIDVYMMNLCEDKNGKVRLLTPITERNMALRLKVKPDKIHYLTGLMALLGMATKVDDEGLVGVITTDEMGNEEDLLTRLERSKTHTWDKKKKQWVERKKPMDYRTNVVELGSLMENFTTIEERCVVLVERGFTKRALCREYTIRTFGMEMADIVFPQDKGRVISKKSNDFADGMIAYAMKQIEDKNYVSPAELLLVMQKKWKGKGFTERNYAKVLGELLEGYDLKKVPLTKALAEELSITKLSPIGGPRIIIKNHA